MSQPLSRIVQLSDIHVWEPSGLHPFDFIGKRGAGFANYRLRRRGEYSITVLRAAIAKALEETVLPHLSEHLTVSFMTTPQDFHDNLLSYQGAAFGLEPILLQSAWFRPHNLSEDIQNLFMVGASTHPGAGIPGVLMSAKAVEKVLPDVASFQRSM